MTTHREQLERVIECLEILIEQGEQGEDVRRVIWTSKSEDVMNAPGGSKVGWKIETGDEFNVLAEAVLGRDVWYQLGAEEWVKAAVAITI